MKNRYTFQSALTYAEICSRIAAHAVPAKPRFLPPGNTLFYRFYDNGCFTLQKTPAALPASGQTPFRGKVVLTPIGSQIVGRFSPPPSILFVLIPFCLLPIIPILVSGTLIMFPFYILWVGYAFWLFYWLAPRLWRKERDAVLAFIREYLLS